MSSSNPEPISSRRFSLHDGHSIMIREVTPLDKHHFRSGMSRLSKISLYHRFHSFSYTPDELDIAYFTHTDQQNHVAIGALDMQTRKETGVGVARFIRLNEDPSKAEIAITVIDDFQTRGIGSLLFSELSARAVERQVSVFRIHLLAERRSLILKLRKQGAVITDISGATVEMELPVSGF